MRIVLLGIQGSGKGTQGDLLEKKYKIPHIASGELFRKICTEHTPLGQKIKELIDNGNLVPDDLTISMIKQRMDEPDCRKGYVLDGFPRTIPQAEALDKITDIEYAIMINLHEAEVYKRLGARIQCPQCKTVYSMIQQPELKQGAPCKNCNGTLVIRDDDKPEAIKKRIDDYFKKTTPIVNYYQMQGKLWVIDGDQPVEKVFKDIEKILAK